MQPQCSPRVTTLSPNRPEVPGSPEGLQPQVLQLCRGQQVLGGLGKGPTAARGHGSGEQPQPGGLHRSQLPARLATIALLRQRAIAGFSCPGCFFPPSMNHLLKIL